MGDYEDLCNESAEALEAAHARIEALTKRVAELVPQLHAANTRVALLEAVLKEIEPGGCPCCGSEPWVNIDCHVCVAASEALKGGT